MKTVDCALFISITVQLVKNLDQEQALRMFHSCNQVSSSSQVIRSPRV